LLLGLWVQVKAEEKLRIVNNNPLTGLLKSNLNRDEASTQQPKPDKTHLHANIICNTI